MNCKQIKEELVFLFIDNEMGQELLISFRRHVSDCPHCAREAQHARFFLTLLRERAGRHQAPRALRTRILASLPHRRGVR
jgi:mycothiol system anti-sigma-R factor